MAKETDTASPSLVEEQTAKPQLVVHWWKVAAVVLIGPPILAAIAADIANNYTFGMKALGTGGALVALAVGLLFAGVPVLAKALGGMNWRLRVGQIVFGSVIVAFAAMAYGEQQASYSGLKASAGLEVAGAANARQRASEARTEAMRINEPLSVGALASLEASARDTHRSAEAAAKAQKLECTQTKRCREAKGALEIAINRKGMAEAKANLLAEAERLERMASQNGDKPASMSQANVNATAAFIASKFGGQGIDAEQTAFLILSGLILLATLVAGVMGEDLIEAACGMFVWVDPTKPTAPTPQPEKPETTKPKGTAKTVSNIIKTATRSFEPPIPGLEGFLKRCEQTDTWTPQSEIMAAVKLWYQVTNSGGGYPSPHKLKEALIAAGFSYEPNNKSLRTPARYNVKLPVIKSPQLAGTA